MRKFVIVVAAVVLSSFCAAQQVSSVPQPDAERIVGAASVRHGAMDFLEVLADRIGPRVTGSNESKNASDLIRKALADAGLQNVHFEDFPIASGWKRGAISGRVISPVSRTIFVGSYGWAPGTHGPIQANVVETTLSESGSFDIAPGNFQGAAVIVNIATGTTSYSNNYVVLRAKAIRKCAEAGAVAMLIPSDKPHRMLYTSAYGIYPRAALPVLSLAKEDALFIRRLLKNDPVKLELDVHNDFEAGSKAERNVIAEIPGTSGDVVVVGAHFDSWDWAQGANDNGSGVAAVLEAARILNSLGMKPKATLRFVFFSGEEQGCLGSRAYLAAHRPELNAHRIMLFMDGGAQKPIGLSPKGRRDLMGPLRPLSDSLRVLGAGQLILDSEVGSDDEAFIGEGIPAIELMTEPGDYDANHHAITDTLDKVDPNDLAADTAALALTALALASGEHAPSRRLRGAELLDYLSRIGILDEMRMLRGAQWAPPE